MSNFLTINGTPVPVSASASSDVDYQDVGGEVVRAYAGNSLSSIKGQVRLWRVSTPPLPYLTGEGLASTLQLPGAVPCSGRYIGGDAVCYVRSVKKRAVATAEGTRWVVEFELHEAEPAKNPWAIVYGPLASRPAINFTRTSPAYTRDKDGTWREVAPGVPRTTWRRDASGLLVPATLLEPAGTNLIPGNRQRFEGWGPVQGSVPTITQGQTIPGYSPAGAATRIQTTGGTALNKYFVSGGNRPGVTPEAHSIVVANIGLHAVAIRTQGGGPTVRVEPGQTVHAKTSTTASSGVDIVQMATGVYDAAHDLDIVAYAPQITLAAYHLAPILDPAGGSQPTVRAADSLYLDLPPEIRTPGAVLAVYARAVVGASGAEVGGTGATLWGVCSAAGASPRLSVTLNNIDRVYLVHLNGTGTAQTPTPPGTPAPKAGDLLETLSLIWTDSAGLLTGRLIASVNRGPLSAADLPPLAPAAAWSAPRLYVGSRGTAPGVYEYEAMKVWAGRLSGSDGEMMDFMRLWGGR